MFNFQKVTRSYRGELYEFLLFVNYINNRPGRELTKAYLQHLAVNVFGVTYADLPKYITRAFMMSNDTGVGPHQLMTGSKLATKVAEWRTVLRQYVWVPQTYSLSYWIRMIQSLASALGYEHDSVSMHRLIWSTVAPALKPDVIYTYCNDTALQNLFSDELTAPIIDTSYPYSIDPYLSPNQTIKVVFGSINDHNTENAVDAYFYSSVLNGDKTNSDKANYGIVVDPETLWIFPPKELHYKFELHDIPKPDKVNYSTYIVPTAYRARYEALKAQRHPTGQNDQQQQQNSHQGKPRHNNNRKQAPNHTTGATTTQPTATTAQPTATLSTIVTSNNQIRKDVLSGKKKYKVTFDDANITAAVKSYIETNSLKYWEGLVKYANLNGIDLAPYCTERQ